MKPCCSSENWQETDSPLSLHSPSIVFLCDLDVFPRGEPSSWGHPLVSAPVVQRPAAGRWISQAFLTVLSRRFHCGRLSCWLRGAVITTPASAPSNIQALIRVDHKVRDVLAIICPTHHKSYTSEYTERDGVQRVFIQLLSKPGWKILTI